MSDNESSTSDKTEKSMNQEPKEPSSPTQDEPSGETQTDSSTDVAPTRKTRRRPEHKPPPEEQKTPEAQKPAQSQGLTQVIEKAETSLGIPSPEELSAQTEKEKNDDSASSKENKDEGEKAYGVGGAMGMISSSSMGMLSSLTTVVQSTGKTVISGGLDALEFIGKKTMDVLREAKEREEQQKAENVTSETDKKAHYGMLFDEFQGLSHLEALEILSRESEAKVKSVLTTLSGEELAKLKKELQDIKEPFSLMEFDDEVDDDTKGDDGEDFVKELTDALERLQISTSADKLGKARKNAFNHITNIKLQSESPQQEEEEEEEEEKEQKTAVTKCSVEFHKTAEMLLHCNPEGVTATEQAKVLSQVTIVICKEVSLLSKKFTSCLTTIGTNEKGEVLNPLITSVFLEASNSASYIQDAFQLLMPVLEVSHIQRTVESAQ
ncbi:Protein FAM114A2 [Labeo rohita]|uniref:Protein FAM114A2 n=1 Tax=Labeo rohita TaxID=84645 RepID=A0ABQ8LKA5_LABRO|nr:Protein FAM114A2 [Labeo rohita]